MKKTNLLFSAITVMLFLGITVKAYSQDWPQWRGANRDGKVTGFEAPKQWPSELIAKWKVTVGLGDASPVLAGGKLYLFCRVDSNEVTMCLDATTGKEIWQNKYAALAISGPSANAHPGPRSTPTVGEGKIVTFGIGGVLSCLDAATGKVVWRNEDFTKDLPKFFTGTSPLIMNGTCIIHLGGVEKGELVAFDLKSGKVKWQCASDGSAYSSLSVMTIDGKKQLLDLTDKNLIGVEPESGKVLWQIAEPVKGMSYNTATPVVFGQTVIITGGGQGTKAIKVAKQGDEFVAQELWTNAEVGTKFNTPALKDGFLYGLSTARKLYCMNATTGQTVWIDDKIQNDGVIVDTGNLLIAVTQNSNLIVYKPDEKAYTEVAVIKVADTPIFAYPICAKDKIYIKDKESLAMMAVK